MKSFTSGCNSTPPPPGLVRLIHPVCYHTKPGLSSILHFLKPPSASLYCHGVVYDTVAKITSHSGCPSECALSITAARHCTAARQPIANTRTPPGPLAGIHGLTDPIYEPPEAQLSKRCSIPALPLSQWHGGRVLMVTVSKETTREIQQG